MNRRALGLFILVVFQVSCALFFISDILSSVIGIRSRPMSWQMREIIELLVAAGLMSGVILGAVVLRRTIRSEERAREKLRRASGAFMDMLEETFDQWGLTPAERDVTLFSVKGFSISEIAQLRGVSDGTIKAQTNAIYRKAGVSGRSQLLALFIDQVVELPEAGSGSSGDGSPKAA
ncbi:helix-turn-helix transcriptional regulator [Pseudooceanicola sp. MF1-13]|uniref:helix-turn-helix transcriptional regulator n=1 Tax=Pseudooceanicola sp. MF1-13 TaxID=3379095 RepID=UPI003891548F